MASDKLCCPFCAAEGRETSETDFDYPSKRFMFIQCSRCGARTASIYGSGDPSEWADARSNWNTRITSPTATDAQGVGEAPKAVADDAIALDAARWRWLKAHGAKVYGITPDNYRCNVDFPSVWRDGELESRVDAAMLTSVPSILGESS